MPYTRNSKRRLYTAITKHLPYERKESYEKDIFGAEYYSFIFSR
jgi:hypothetical protein